MGLWLSLAVAMVLKKPLRIIGKVRTIILGMGNPMRGDDSVGLHAVRALRDKLNKLDITVIEASGTGMDCLELLTGYDRAVIIDAIHTMEGKTGQIYRLELDAFDTNGYANTSHDVDFVTAIELGRRLGLALPRQIVIFAIEVGDAHSFSEECTAAARQAIPNCVGMICQELSEHSNA